jgi:hypothetical protein
MNDKETNGMNIRKKLLAGAVALALGFTAACNGDPAGPGVSDAPSQVINLTVSEANGQLQLSWSAATNASSYTVERDVLGDNSGFAQISTDLSGTSYTDNEVAEGTTYLYRVIGVGSGGAGIASDPVEGALRLTVSILSGTISETLTLDPGLTYILRGIVLVDAGGVLNIPAGTELQGDPTVQPSALLVRKGGVLNSLGTAEAPVVFTSGNPVGERRRGDWGGVVLNGRSLCNFPAGQCVGEGSSGPYGGDLLDDNSGIIAYTRIEFAGFEVSFGNELNALTLNGVGSGTQIHHVQTHMGLDDGVELFGGTVDLKYMLSTGISDDSFDYSTGWQGRGQFWIVQQDPNDADNGFEVDGNEDDFNAQPFTQPQIYNVTLVGKGMNGAGGTAGESVWGMLLRRGTGGDIFNAIVTGFGRGGIDIDNAETVGRATVQNSIVFGNAVGFSNDDDGIDDQGYVMDASNANRLGVDPLLADAFNRTAPDFRPQAGSPALDGSHAVPPAEWFDAVDFIGAVDPDVAPWYEGWTSFINN